MKDTRLKQKKREALYALYKEGLSEGRFTSVRDAARFISKQPAPSFFISDDRASWLVGKRLDNQSIHDLHSSQRRMADQLFRDYKEYLLNHPGTKKSRIQIMSILVERPAPEFYMTADAIRRMLREEIRLVKQRMGWGD